jgi:hypothetical protein
VYFDKPTDIAYAIGWMRDGKMHQTTVRFGPDLWEALEIECARLGVSAAQFLREAAVARLAYTAGRRGERGYESAFAGGGTVTAGDRSYEADLARFNSATATGNARDRTREAGALAAQGEQVRARANEVRAHSVELRKQMDKWHQD